MVFECVMEGLVIKGLVMKGLRMLDRAGGVGNFHGQECSEKVGGYVDQHQF